MEHLWDVFTWFGCNSEQHLSPSTNTHNFIGSNSKAGEFLEQDNLFHILICYITHIVWASTQGAWLNSIWGSQAGPDPHGPTVCGVRSGVRRFNICKVLWNEPVEVVGPTKTDYSKIGKRSRGRPRIFLTAYISKINRLTWVRKTIILLACLFCYHQPVNCVRKQKDWRLVGGRHGLCDLWHIIWYSLV